MQVETMDFDLDTVPTWAHNWCYVFAFLGFMAIGTAIAGLLFGKSMGMQLTIISFIAAMVNAATSFTFFWMCRRSLA